MTIISCGYFCKHNEKGICQSKEVLIDEDRTCSNFKYDVSKAECGFCEHYDGDNQKCETDEEYTTHDCNCHNGKFSGV